MEENTTNNDNAIFPKSLKLISLLSICFGIIITLLQFFLLLFWMTFGAFEYDGCKYLSDHSFWQLYLHHFLPALYGMLLFAGGKWCLEIKKHGWFLISFCYLVPTLLWGLGLYSIITTEGFHPCLIVFIVLFCIFSIGYFYLFSKEVKTFLNIQRIKNWQVIIFQIAFLLLLLFLFRFIL